MWNALSQDEYIDHIEIQVQAVEAAARKAPAQRTVLEDDGSAAFEKVWTTMTDEQIAVLDDLNAGTARTDAEACTAIRLLHHGQLALGPADRATVARWVVSP
jgi:hypothetical protein